MANDRVGYLGPEGSFSHEAVNTLVHVEPIAYPTLEDLLAAVADATLDQGLVPLENALEGTVSATIDSLVFAHELVILQEIVLPIHLHLLARPGVSLEAVTAVLSYVHALAQVRDFVHDHEFETVQSTSTSQAASDVALSPEPWAAVGSALAGQLFGLDVIAVGHRGSSR